MAAIDVCEACGEGNPPGSAFCLYCGVYLGWDENDAEGKPPAPTRAPTTATAAATAPPPPHARPDVAPAPTPPTAVRAAAPGETPCPACGHPNGPTRRFCGKCGQPLRSATVGAQITRQETARRPWWSRFRDPADRQARRAYRRSLPPLYRWRRVLISLVAIAGVVGLLTVMGRNPVGWAKDKYYDVRDSLVVVEGVKFAATPAASTAKGYSVGALASPEPDDAWATAWSGGAMAPVKDCDGQKSAKGMVTLVLPEPVRVRHLEVLSGLPAEDDSRPFVFRPSRIFVMYGAGECTPLDLRDESSVQRVAMDTGRPVERLTIAVGAAYPARADAKQDLVAISSIKLLSRPG